MAHYDPTNRLGADYDLIAVAIARHPRRAVPMEGSSFGNAQDYLGMSVDVAVHELGEVTDPSEGQAPYAPWRQDDALETRVASS